MQIQLRSIHLKHLLKIITFAIFAALFTTNMANAKTLLVFGDSLSAAYGIDPKQGWVHLLRKELKGHKIINASVSGETTQGGLRRLPAVLNQHQPDIVILELGANDGLRGQSIKQMRKNLTSMISLIKGLESKPTVLLAGMHIPPNYGKRYTKNFGDSFPLLAQSQNVTLIPFLLDGVAGNPKYTQNDGLHPNAVAQPIILRNILPYVKEVI